MLARSHLSKPLEGFRGIFFNQSLDVQKTLLPSCNTCMQLCLHHVHICAQCTTILHVCVFLFQFLLSTNVVHESTPFFVTLNGSSLDNGTNANSSNVTFGMLCIVPYPGTLSGPCVLCYHGHFQYCHKFLSPEVQVVRDFKVNSLGNIYPPHFLSEGNCVICMWPGYLDSLPYTLLHIHDNTFERLVYSRSLYSAHDLD